MDVFFWKGQRLIYNDNSFDIYEAHDNVVDTYSNQLLIGNTM